MKFSDKGIIGKYYKDVLEKFDLINSTDLCKIEEAILKSSIVADVGGFLYTDKMIKRTSRIKFSYMIPTQDAIELGAALSYPQLHVRYTPEAVKKEQALYYVETASALYSFTAGLNASDIAELSSACSLSIDLAAQKKKRIEACIRCTSSSTRWNNVRSKEVEIHAPMGCRHTRGICFRGTRGVQSNTTSYHGLHS
jgi:CRISPR-associated protein Csa2